MAQGKIKKIVAEKGFGFISAEGGEELFFHHSELRGSSIEQLQEGQSVSYTVGQGRKGPCAKTVQVGGA